ESIEQYKEIAVHYHNQLPEFYNKLTPEEKIFAYYIYRASIACTSVAFNLNHRCGKDIIDIFYALYKNADKLKNYNFDFDIEIFNKQVKTYFVYLFTNYGQYFSKEHKNNKRIPKNLNLDKLTYDNILKSLKYIKYKD